MNRLRTIRDLFRHFDWTADRLLSSAETLADAVLDRPFEMGVGTLRKTLAHAWAAHWTWFQRLAGVSPSALPFDGARVTLAELRGFIAESRAARDESLGGLRDEDLDRVVHYANTRGESFGATARTILMHVCNHAAHHQAQAVNMLRHGGVAKPPRVDYIFMYFEHPDWPPPALSVAVLREYFAYTDWARDRVFDVAERLDDASLDRPFEMGIGSIRKNLAHTHDAEAWWLTNWLAGKSEAPFPKTDETIPLRDLRARFDETAEKRNEFLARTTDADLPKPVEGMAAPGRVFQFPLGVTMVQLNTHATHHRAQTINMLRHCGRPTPATDYTIWARERNT